MAVVPYQVQGLDAQQSDGNILLTWDASLGATSYKVQRSTDGVNFTDLVTVGQVLQYLDSLPGVGIMYYYQVAGVSTDGDGPYSSVAKMVAAPPSEMSLFELRLRAQQTADRVESPFVTTSEWNAFARVSMYELYDLLIGAYEDYDATERVTILTNGTTQYYPLPNGVDNYLGNAYTGVSGAPAKAFYKLSGVDLAVNTSTVNPAWVTLRKFNFADRNKFIYPNSTSTIYGVYNQAYRIMGQQIEFIPVPAGNQTVRLTYAPRLPGLLMDTDLTTIGFSGWLRYPIARMAKYALDKEEGSDTSKLDQEILFLKQRIQEMAQNRDQGMPDTISDTRRDSIYGGWSSGGGNAGWALFPMAFTNDIGNGLLDNPILASNVALGYAFGFISVAYLFYKNFGQLCRPIFFSGASKTRAPSNPFSTFCNHVARVVERGAQK